MSRRHEPEYRTSSAGGWFVALAAALVTVLALNNPTPAPAGPDINIAIDVPPAPTTVPAPTTTAADLGGAQASGQPQTSTGITGTAGVQRATDWAQDFVRNCIIRQLTARGICLLDLP